jgi:hypothetical protein
MPARGQNRNPRRRITGTTKETARAIERQRYSRGSGDFDAFLADQLARVERVAAAHLSNLQHERAKQRELSARGVDLGDRRGLLDMQIKGSVGSDAHPQEHE